MKVKKIAIAVAIILISILTFGLFVKLNTKIIHSKPDISEEVKKEIKIADVAYNPTYGTDFKENYPISMLTLTDNMEVAPYAYLDTTLFSNKRITKIDAPIATVSAVDENQYFTLFVIKKSQVRSGGCYTNTDYKEFKVYLPSEELTSTTVDKWISIDLSDQFIYVAEDETLAFMKSDDPVTCHYATIAGDGFIYDLNSSGREMFHENIYYGIYTDDCVDLIGKNISILGDSISTFNGISNDASNTNSTIGGNAVWYPNGAIDKSSETWWAQTAEATGMNVLVNNSWSGSRVLNGSGAAYQTRCQQLHDNTGDNAGTNPDVIAVYIGINDFNAGLALGSFEKLSDVYSEKDGYSTPETVAEAYAIMIHKMIEKYDTSDVFLFTLPENGTNRDTATLAKYNEMIKKIAAYFDCYVLDIANIEGYEYSAHTIDGLHPNEQGMDLITDLFVRTLKGVFNK